MECIWFYPGLVGGHCIGRDPYYDSMGQFVADAIIRKLILKTFKENCPDTRNSKVIDIMILLRGYKNIR